ncbi:MAG: BON domain-containing protein [Candidatus Competibacteraceae bacterium]|nr:BON domain-containing protein [Candidatus Competibacteraceae bacterium]MCB1806331.1 BON domain-containing protein [Candidatus Competibacteraceae bacterium]MCB1812931.1 BON domain-containing protein [Candidatus Competibacteraceae bacterium]
MSYRIYLVPLLVLLLSGLTGCGPTLILGGATAASIVHDRRTAGTVIEDQSIELKAYEILQQQKQAAGATHINVTSYNARVLLSGEVATEELRLWAEQAVARIEKVKHVYNELRVSAPSSLASRSNDGWITTKVKSSMLQIGGLPGFDPSRVKVVTERGIVYLMGLLTEQEADAVTATVRRVSGVQQVVKLFEYI